MTHASGCQITFTSVKSSFVGTWADVQFTISNTGKFVASAGSISYLDTNKSGCKNIPRNGPHELNAILTYLGHGSMLKSY